MRILHICPAYVHPSYRASGVSKAAFDLAETMAKLGHDIDFVAPLVELGKTYPLPKDELISVGGCLRLHYVPEARTTRFGTDARGLGRTLAPLLPECDIVHVHAFLSPWTDKACRLAACAGKPYVIQPHGKLSKKMLANRAGMKQLYLRTFGRGVLRRAAGVSLLSQPTAEFLYRWDPHIPQWVCPNGLEPDVYEGPLPSRPIAPPYILYLGMLDPRKRVDILIDAFAGLKKGLPQESEMSAVKLALVGGDNYGLLDQLISRIRSLGIVAEVILPGHVTGERKLQWLRHAELFCLSSEGEGLSLAMLEALACGLPCLLSQGCNAPIVAECGAGEILSMSCSDWEQGMRRLMFSPDLRQAMSIQAKKVFKNNFTIRKVTEVMLGKYEDMLR